MDVQKYIKRLKFARADWSRNIGDFTSREDAINFLNAREFFFGDPFVVKYTENGEAKLMLAIGKSENPEIEAGTTEVTGGVGPEAYELLDVNGIRDELERLWEALNEEISARTESDAVIMDELAAEASARTAADEDLQEQIDEIKDAIDVIEGMVYEISGATGDIKEIVGDGWTDSPDNVTLTDRIKRDEELAGIVWGHNDGEPYDGHLPNANLPYASGNSLAEMVGTISDTLNGVLFKDGDDVKAIEFDYNADRNILYYTAGTQTGEIALSQASVVERAYYDSETEELVIVFVLGEGKKQEVRIPVGGLISEWETVDTDTVHLERERVAGGGNDKLSADVKVSDDDDNMLVAKGDGLYVSSEKIDAANDRIDAVAENVEELDGTLYNVIDVLKLADDGHFIEGSFTGEHTRGVSNYRDAINALDSAVTAVENFANDSVEELSGRIDSVSGELPTLKTMVEADVYAEHLTVESRFGEDGNLIYTIGENDIASKSNVEEAINGINGKIDEMSGASQGLEERVEALENQVSEHSDSIADLGGAISTVSGEVQDTNDILDNIKTILNTEEDGHFTERFIGPHTSSVDTYYDAINVLDGALVDAEDASRDMGNSFELSYDEQGQKIILTWQVDGVDKSSNVDVSDFVKDSFLEGVQVVNHEGVQCLEFRFKTYDGEPVPLYVPLTELATIYKAGDGIDKNELEDNQVITVKIDEFGSFPNFLAKSANGLRVTGVTEAIQDAIEHADFSAYVKKAEVEGHLDSASTLPVQNRVITEALAALEREITGQTSDALTGVIMTGAGNVVTAVTKNGFDVEAKLGSLNFDEYVKKSEVEDHLDSASTLPVQNKVITDELEGLKDSMSDLEESLADLIGSAITDVNVSGSGNVVTNISKNGNALDVEFGSIDLSTVVSVEEFNAYTASTATALTSENITVTGLTANTIYADEYENLPTATTSQYGVVILDDELKLDSTNPVENSAVTFAINELASAISEESQSREEADGELHNMITAETRSREESYSELHDLVTAETRSREEADDELHDMITAETQAREEEDNELWDAIDALSGGGITGATTTGSGNVVVEIYKEGKNVVGRLGNVNVSDKLDVTVFETFTGNTLNDVQENGSGPFVASVSKSGDKVVATKSNSLRGLDGISASTIYGGNYENLPTATTSNYGMVKVDSAIDSASTNPVENRVIYNELDSIEDAIEELASAGLTGVTSTGSGQFVSSIEKDGSNVKATLSNSLSGLAGITADTISATTYMNMPVVTVDTELSTSSTNAVENRVITQTILDNELVTSAAINDLNDRKANIEDIPSTINDLEGHEDIAMKSDLAGFLPLSGGTMTGNISGSTGNAIFMPGGFFQDSDERLKIFAGELENALEKANEIPTKYFYWKNLVDGPRQLGTSAQKVQELFPEIVSGEEKLSVDYSKLAVVALAAIKELTAKVEDLQNQLNELKK